MFIRYLSRMYRCSKGATIIEFAIVAPVLFLLLIGFIEFGLIFFTSTVLESATGIGSRIGKTGFGCNAPSRDEYIRSEIVRLSGGYLNPADININILSYDSFNNIGQPERCTTPGDSPPCPLGFIDTNGDGIWSPDQGVAGPGRGRAVSLYRVTYPWAVFTPLMRQIIGDANGNLDISATATVRNEDFTCVEP